MLVIGRRDGDGVDVFVVEQLAKIGILLSLHAARCFQVVGGFIEVLGIDVAETAS